MNDVAGDIRRRRCLTALGSIAASSFAGCLDRLTNADDDRGDSSLDITIRAVPSDEDPAAAEIGRRLSEHLSDAGVDAAFVPRLHVQLREEIHFDGDFDVFVARTPRITDPDDLRPMFHSDFADDVGAWLNPFGFTDETVDEALEQQRRAQGTERREVIDEVQRLIALEHVPVSAVIAPDELTAVSTRLGAGDRPLGFDEPSDVIALVEPPLSDPISHLRVGLLDGQVTEYLNPLADQPVGHPVVIGLIYDQLVRPFAGHAQPWAAAEISWQIDADPPIADVRLRQDMTWTDGEPVEVEDIIFTFEFLSDLAADDDDASSRPAALYASQMTNIESVDLLESDQIRFEFVETSQFLASRALAVPILPRHVWEPLAGVDDSGVPLPLHEPNLDPVGSGPFRLTDAEPGSHLELERNDEHYVFEDAPELFPISALDHITLEVPTHPPSVGTAVDLVGNEDLHVIPKYPPEAVRQVVETDGVSLAVRPSSRRYVIGFNTSDPPCDDSALRRVIARTIDRQYTWASVFRGFGTRGDSLLAGTDYEADDLVWTGESQLGRFPGTSGFVDVDALRALFEEAGYPYDSERDVILTQS